MLRADNRVSGKPVCLDFSSSGMDVRIYPALSQDIIQLGTTIGVSSGVGDRYENYLIILPDIWTYSFRRLLLNA
jgi:hypothetical protein